MKILVTGGAGFIGSCFIRHMLTKYPDYKIFNLDSLTYAGNINNLYDVKDNPNYTFVNADITDKNLSEKIGQNVDCIINFAAETHVDRSILNPEIFIKTNVLGTLNLLEYAKDTSVSRYIQVSTDEVYGSLGCNGYFSENSPLAPNSPYSASKASADMLVRAYFETYKMPVIITRCSNNYGPYQYPEKLIPFFISRLLKGQKVPLYGDGLNVRDWLYVYDHCSAIDTVLHKGLEGEVYNIGAHCEKSNIEIAKIILREMNKDESFIEYVQDRAGHDRRYAIDNTKITNTLGWSPVYTFDEGIKTTINWYLNNESWIASIKKRT